MSHAAFLELQAQCRRARLLSLAALIGLIALSVANLAQQFSNRTLLRTRGIAIVDESGRDRILIGAPIPDSKDRVRTDEARVEKHWAARFGGEKYMSAYREYDHSANGILILNEQGFDRLALADHIPDPNTGKRLVDSAGLVFNDDEGFERGGLGVSKTREGKTRVVLGMDDETVGEAVHLFVLEDGTKALRVGFEGGVLLVGRAPPNSELFGNSTEFAGILVRDPEGKVLLESNALKP